LVHFNIKIKSINIITDPLRSLQVFESCQGHSDGYRLSKILTWNFVDATEELNFNTI
jgi:hypothetical protein